MKLDSLEYHKQKIAHEDLKLEMEAIETKMGLLADSARVLTERWRILKAQRDKFKEPKKSTVQRFKEPLPLHLT